MDAWAHRFLSTLLRLGLVKVRFRIGLAWGKLGLVRIDAWAHRSASTLLRLGLVKVRLRLGLEQGSGLVRAG